MPVPASSADPPRGGGGDAPPTPVPNAHRRKKKSRVDPKGGVIRGREGPGEVASTAACGYGRGRASPPLPSPPDADDDAALAALSVEPPENRSSSLSIDPGGWISHSPLPPPRIGAKTSAVVGGPRAPARLLPELLPGCRRLVDIASPAGLPGCEARSESDLESELREGGGSDTDADAWISDAIAGRGTPPPTSTEGLEGLRRVEGLFQTATRAIDEIERMAAAAAEPKEGMVSVPPPAAVGGGGERAAASGGMKPSAKQQRAAARHRARIEHLEKAQLAGIRRRRGESGSGDELSGDAPEDATPPASARAALAFNSLRAALVVLVPMMCHPRRLDETLTMAEGVCLRNGAKDEKKGRLKNKRCYLLGTHVFGTTTVGGLSSLERRLGRMTSMVDPNLFSRIERKDASLLSDPPAASLRLVAGGGEGAAGIRSPSSVAVDALGPFLIREGAAQRQMAEEIDVAVIRGRFERSKDDRDRHGDSIKSSREALIQAIRKRFLDARIDVYGSCLSELTLDRSSDVDLSLEFPEVYKIHRQFVEGKITASWYDKQMRNFVFQIQRSLSNHANGRFTNVISVTNARVPVVKGTDPLAGNPHSEDGSLR